jgi:hypothetical protein
LLVECDFEIELGALHAKRSTQKNGRRTRTTWVPTGGKLGMRYSAAVVCWPTLNA